MPKLWSILSPVSPGKTAFQLNLAYLMAKMSPEKQVLAVDFNFLKPDLAAFLDFSVESSGTKTLVDLYNLLLGYQTIVLEDFLTIPFNDLPNLRILPGDLEAMNPFENVSRDLWFKFFKQLRDTSEVILFEAGRNVHHSALQFLIAESDLLFICTEPDPLALLHTRSLIHSLISQGRLEDLRLVLLRYRPESAITLDYISKLLPIPVHTIIPNVSDREYQKQFLDAQLIAKNDKHPYTKSLMGFLDKMAEVPKVQEVKNLYGRLY